MSNVDEVNAAFDVLWAARNATIDSIPAMFRGIAQGMSTRDQVLATAYKVVAAINQVKRKGK